MISAGDAEFPRDYHTLAAGGRRGTRQFPDNTNGGFTSSSLDRRHNAVAAKSLEALNSIHKADIERQRDALMDLQKNKYSNSPGSMSQGSAAASRQVNSLLIHLTNDALCCHGNMIIIVTASVVIVEILVSPAHNNQPISHTFS